MTTKTFSKPTWAELEALVMAGDATKLLDQLATMPLANRLVHSAAALDLRERSGEYIRTETQNAQGGLNYSHKYVHSKEYKHCASLIVIACCSHQRVGTVWARAEDVVEVAARCELAGLDSLADTWLGYSPGRMYMVHVLVVAGVVPRPVGQAYTLGLVTLTAGFDPDKKVVDYLKEDPALVPLLLDLFEVEGTREFNLENADSHAGSLENRWSHIFLQLCRDGIYARALLLDKTLGTLERDWPQFRSRWFSQFHASLAPTVEEMAPLATRYLGLCQSRIPPTVTLALTVLKVLQAANKVEGRALLDALQPVFYARAKSQVDAALKLVDAVVKRDSTLASAASGVALHGLVHEASDLQKKIIDRLQAWGVDGLGRQALAAYEGSVAAVNRPALTALIAALPGQTGKAVERLTTLTAMTHVAPGLPLKLSPELLAPTEF